MDSVIFLKVSLVEEDSAILEPGIEHPDFFQLDRAMMNDLGMRRLQRSGCIPRAEIGIIESRSMRIGMTERRHDHAGHWLSYNPLIVANPMQHAQLRGDAVIGPAFQLEDER